MDIERVLDAMDPADRPDQPTPKSDRKYLFVAPAPDRLPDDGMLTYIEIVGIYDVRDVPERAVLLFSRESFAVLKLLAENQIVFGVELHQLVGLPEADYSLDFDQVTWNLEKVSYAPLVSEISLAMEAQRQVEAASQTMHDIERQQYTRQDGSVREQKGFKVTGASSHEHSESNETDEE